MFIYFGLDMDLLDDILLYSCLVVAYFVWFGLTLGGSVSPVLGLTDSVTGFDLITLFLIL